MKEVAPGDEQCPVPPPVDELPPEDRFCDLVMTGGVASGVVYPWAIVELARVFRFRNIGGTSVGAMAAVLAAAAEYGRRNGFDQSFETLRRLPGALGEVLPDGRTRMLSLFQTNAKGRRLIKLWGSIGQGQRGDAAPPQLLDREAPRPPPPPLKVSRWQAACKVFWAYRWPVICGAAVGLLLFVLAYKLPCSLACGLAFFLSAVAGLIVLLVLLLLGSLLGLFVALWHDLRWGLIENGLGLCKGGTLEAVGPEGRRPGLTEWLHDGVQFSAGLERKDRALSFRDLWSAPARPGAEPLACGDDDPAAQRSINLQLITTNVTHGRPYRLPLEDETSRLFYKPQELKDYFPCAVLKALTDASRRYARKSRSDPLQIDDAEEFRELPGADLPLVVAARLSLSFPLLFSAVPLWAIDYEAESGKRQTLRRCQFTDGGASSNFPIHLFDAAIPRWPTFGLWLDRRDPKRPPRAAKIDEDVWLPEFNGEGWGDNWDRFDPASDASATAGARKAPGLRALVGFLFAIARSSKDWRDRTSIRMPHVRNRVARLWLEKGHGGLHIGMSRAQILNMAHRFGTVAGKEFVERFSSSDSKVKEEWSEQRWVRLQLLVQGLRERLDGLAQAARWNAHTLPLSEALAEALKEAPIRSMRKTEPLPEPEIASLSSLLAELEVLESQLNKSPRPAIALVPAPELRLRAPL